jgi:hypothetical protein
MAYAFEIVMEDGTTSSLIRLKPRLRANSAAADAWEICQELRNRFPVKSFRMLHRRSDCVRFHPDGREFVLR